MAKTVKFGPGSKFEFIKQALLEKGINVPLKRQGKDFIAGTKSFRVVDNRVKRFIKKCEDCFPSVKFNQ